MGCVRVGFGRAKDGDRLGGVGKVVASYRRFWVGGVRVIEGVVGIDSKRSAQLKKLARVMKLLV